MRFILPLVIFLSGTASAEEVATASYRDFSGGLNNYYSPTSLQPNESPNLLNVVIDEPVGALTQRNGYLTCGNIPSGNTATNLYEYSKNDGSRNLIVTDNVTIWSTIDCVVYSTITTGWSSQALPRFATVLDKLWIVNGSTWPYVWDGSSGHYLDGTGTYPTGPKGKYITYWKSRVWIANTPTAPSSVYFTSLTDITGVAVDPATSTSAWTSTNQIYFNRDDGSPIYGIKPYRDNLYVWKETGISRLVFESEYSLSGAKNVSAIGSKFQESIVEMDDGLLRFVGRDGVYAFDGSTVKRVSTKWTPTFESFKQPSRGEQYKLWDSASDFLTGTITPEVSTIPVDGALSLMYEDFSDLDYTHNPIWSSNSDSDPSLYAVPSATNGYLSEYDSIKNSQVYIASNKAYGDFDFSFMHPGATGFPYAYFISFSTGSQISGYGVRVVGGKIRLFKQTPLPSTICETTGVIPSSQYKTNYANVHVNRTNAGLFTLTMGTFTCSGTDVTYSSSAYSVFLFAPYDRIDDIKWIYRSTGTYYSEISTFTNLSQWGTFGVDETLGGQPINYYTRTAPTVGGVASAPWTSISAGAIVSTTTNGYGQWRADFTTTDNSVDPLINSVSMGYATGDTTRSILGGVNYKSRYWISASTTPTNNYNDIVMVESKSPLGTYTRHNLPLSALATWNNSLYAAISNTSKIARVDYGSADDGTAITSYWESRDEAYDQPIFYKTINTGILDYANSPANTGLNIGLSADQGLTYEDKTVNIGASTLARNTTKLNWTPNTAIGFRTRIYNNVLGFGFKVYGVHNMGTITDFFGN